MALWTPVDIAAPYRFADYAAGRDPAMDAALGYKKGPSLNARLLDAAKGGGKDAVRKAVEAYRQEPVNRYADIPQQVLKAAQYLNASKHSEEALLAAELAAIHYPDHSDAPLVLAYLAEANGKIELAREAGKRTLQLDPNNRLARTLLERLPSPTR